MNSAKNRNEIKNPKIPRGYRLKASTHNKIKELQYITNSSQDFVITKAVRIYLKQLKQQATV